MIRRKLGPSRGNTWLPTPVDPRIISRIHSRASGPVPNAVSQTAETGRTCSCFHLATLRQDHKQDSIRIRVSCRNALNIAARRLPLSFSFGLSFSPSLIVCILIRGARSRADYGQMELLTRTRPLDDKRVRERALIKYYIREGFIRRE